MVKKSVVKVVELYLQELNNSGIEVSSAIIFGSFSDGTFTNDSDIDLIVISTLFDETYPRKLIDTLWQVAARIDSRIEPIPCGCKQWIDDDVSAVIEIARKNGVLVKPGIAA